jgi:hypothetical protein
MDERRDGPSPLELERYLLGEQSEEERRGTEQRLDLATREQLVREDEALRGELFARLPPSVLAARVKSRLERPRRARWWFAVPAVAALSLASLVVVTGLRDEGPGTERAKGLELELRVYRQAGEGVERLSDGAEVRAGDVLQLGYVRGEYGHGVLLSIDGRGAVTLHQPPSRDAPTQLAHESGQVLLESAYELDDAPGFERFVFVVAHEPFTVEHVLAAARALAKDRARASHDPLLLPVRTAQRSLLLRKTP